jgi:hypothetical protein
MKAKIDQYNLMIPKEGFAPMLFLEWIRDNGHINNLLYRICSHSKEGYFSIRLNRHASATMEDCMNYINANI